MVFVKIVLLKFSKSKRCCLQKMCSFGQIGLKLCQPFLILLTNAGRALTLTSEMVSFGSKSVTLST